MYGIRISLPNSGIKLYNILKNSTPNDHMWKILENESYLINKENNFSPFLNKVYYNKMDFEKEIEKEAYIMFINLQLYPNIKEDIEICSPNDFINSTCKAILIITDNIFCDIFVKSKKIFNSILSNIMESKLTYSLISIEKRKNLYAHGE